MIDEARAAIAARREYDKGRHLAQPDMADGFAHACGRTNGAVLLYNGDDFSLTDMAR